MTTNNRSYRTIIAIIVIAILSIMLSACNGDAVRETTTFVSNASYSESDPASIGSLQSSPRTINCGASSKQLINNDMNNEIDPQTGKVGDLSIGEWLSGKMLTYGCIITIDQVNEAE